MDRSFRRHNLKAIVVLAIPVVLEEILSTLLQYVDMAMVGRLGEQATAAVSLTTTVNWLIGTTFSAIGIAIVAQISSSYGAGDRIKIRRIASQAILYAVAAGLVVGALAVGLSSVLPIWMQADPAIQKQAGQYFMIISLPLLFRAFTTICASSLRAVKDTKTPMMITLGFNGLNVVMNYIFIYKVGLGVMGAAIATAISSTLTGITMLIRMVRKDVYRIKIREIRLDRDILKSSFRIAFPAFATNFASCMGHIVFASLVSSMGTTVFAAHSIALSAESIFYLPGYGLSSATSALIGISVGEDDKVKFRLTEVQSTLLTVGLMTISGFVLYFFATPIMSIFTPSYDVIALGASVLKLIAISEPLFGLMIASEGIYYGLGQTKNTFIVETIGAWGVRIVFTVLCVNVWHTGLLQVWGCMLADNVFRALALSIPLFAGMDARFFDKRKGNI